MSIRSRLILLSVVLLLAGLGIGLLLSFQEVATVAGEAPTALQPVLVVLSAVRLPLAILSVLLFASAVWLLLSIVRPLQASVQRLPGGESPFPDGVRLPVVGTDELAELCRAFNRTLVRLEYVTASRVLAENVLGVVQDGLIVLDAQNCIQKVNKPLLELFDEQPAEMIGIPLDQLLPDPAFGAVMFRNLLSNRPFQAQETLFQAKGGGSIPVAVTGHLLKEGGAIQGVALLVQDLRSRKQHEAQLHFLANFDALTKLPNRTLLQDRLKHELTRALRANKKIAVMQCALDRFKGINDTLGHRLGDEILQETASRLTSCLRAGDTVARTGGDEFVITLIDMVKVEDIVQLAVKISHSIAVPFLLSNGQECFVTASVGIAVFPEHGMTADELLKNADIATHFSKEQGRNQHHFYRSEMNKKGDLRLALESDLRRAIERGELETFYQPRWDLKKDVIVGAEALVRWRKGGDKLISPADFLPLAEELGLIESIDIWMLQQVCRQAKVWRSGCVPALRISVNLSHHLFQRKDLVRIVNQALDAAAVPSDALELELTEAIVMDDVSHAMAALSAMRNMWIHLAVDDFGTGYSSFAYLRRLPVHVLKIDRSFVREITSSQEDAAITRAIIDMARTLKLRTTAEGVEEQAQRDLLAALGCDEMQGYLISRPLPAAEFEAKFLRCRSK
ncbi:MAG: EAL domain-containing protein [Magnetococcales bacterium]|nr:EAL domain-containing protein [Magnetococcales bacterium]